MRIAEALQVTRVTRLPRARARERVGVWVERRKYNALYSDKLAVTDSDGGSIATRLAKMSAAERAAWAAGVAAQARALLKAPTIDHEDR